MKTQRCANLIVSVEAGTRNNPMEPGEEKKCETMDSSWRIAILAAVMAFFGLSSNRSSGYFYTELMNEFNIDRGTASWPVCVLGTLTDTGGVFAGPLARRYSTSSVMICGAVFTSVGMLSSAFAPSITWFTITMGLLHDHLEVSYGLMGLLCAPLLLVKPFLIGYFRDRLGSYDDLYYILAGLIFSLCLLWGLVAFSERRTSKRNALKTNKDTVFK
ncbi:putative monocarboxylate transporter [Ixodes scapularis]